MESTTTISCTTIMEHNKTNNSDYTGRSRENAIRDQALTVGYFRGFVTGTIFGIFVTLLITLIF